MNINWSKLVTAEDKAAESLGKARAAAIGRIEAGYRQALKSFDHAGTTWDASDDSATVLRDHLNRISNGKKLPHGADTVTLVDKAGTSHEMTIDQIVDLGEAGSDHRHDCLQTRLSLLKDAWDAETVEDANAIDWPDA